MDRTRRALMVGALGAAATVTAGTVAVAAIPDGNTNLISGCYNSAGALRVIDSQAGAKCSRGETAIAWNQTGPQGPQGPQGAPSTSVAASGHEGYGDEMPNGTAVLFSEVQWTTTRATHVNFNGALTFTNHTDEPATVVCSVADTSGKMVEGISMYRTIPAGTSDNLALAAGANYASAGTFEAAIRCTSTVRGVIHGGSTLNIVAAG